MKSLNKIKIFFKKKKGQFLYNYTKKNRYNLINRTSLLIMILIRALYKVKAFKTFKKKRK